MRKKVKNLHNTGDRVPHGYSSWLDYWEKNSRHQARSCATVGCGSTTDLVGAHVIEANSDDNKWYIVPVCKGCNNKTKPYLVDTDLIPVNK